MNWSEIFDYDGVNLIWKIMSGTRGCIGKVAGNVSKTNGYVRLRYDGREHKVHRIILDIVNGKIPSGLFVDHINHIRNDNRIENLRLVNRQGNAMNQSLRKTNKTGVLGVSWVPRLSKYVARMGVDGYEYHIGCFDSIEEAARARKSEEVKLGFHRNHGNSTNC
ncbi:HNH homing endonuclease [Escherichia phage vB_EcoS_IME542]|uniref:HNH homing endonuclease n=1 Tax=Escherichia phage vB_EcoS_IME542 TaxID=2507711 RepID=A0A410T6J6_9CAUD|nr:HNH endonuclease [Escherichia phage vB_EcoS_IME542]QAU04440.1 HNH homing endonuclease [Escherichia phage vB_EcoS_IME542]